MVMSSLIDERLSVRNLADRLGVSRAHLYRVFSDGDGIDKAILRERLYAAAQDISASGDPISDIAERYNFQDYSHFSRAFLAEIGMRPTDWRMRARQEGSGTAADPYGGASLPA